MPFRENYFRTIKIDNYDEMFPYVQSCMFLLQTDRHSPSAIDSMSMLSVLSSNHYIYIYNENNISVDLKRSM